MCVLGGSTVRGRAGHAPHGCGRSGLMWSLSFAGRERDCDKRHKRQRYRNGVVWDRPHSNSGLSTMGALGRVSAGFAPDGNSAHAPSPTLNTQTGPTRFAPRTRIHAFPAPCLGTFQPDPKSITTRGRPPWRPRCTVAILRSMFTRSCRPRAMQPCQFWSSCHSSRRSH